MILYRPVGLEELLLIFRTGMKRFPPRLPEQPIFYPVLNPGYAAQIAREWNTTSGSLAGYVTEFEIDDAYGNSFPVQQVGAKQHQELWVPAERLEEFNDKIVGRIRIVGAYFGREFTGLIPKAFSVRGKSARAQLETLREIFTYSYMDFHGEITANREAVFLHYPYWEQVTTENTSSGDDWKGLLEAVRQVWTGAVPDVPLGIQPWR